MSYYNLDLTELATNANYLSTLPVTNITEPAITLLSYHADFEKVLGPDATGRKLLDLPWQAFHEAGVYNKEDNSLYITSNYDSSDRINVTVLSLDDYSVYSTRYADVQQANGATAYFPPGTNSKSGTPPQQVYCDQGDLTHPSQLVAVDPNTNSSKVLLTSYMGLNFSSINDVKQHPRTGDLWFTDAD